MRVLKKSKKHPIPFSPDIIKARRDIIIDRSPDALDRMMDATSHTITLKTAVVNRAVIRMNLTNPNIVYTVKSVYNGYLAVDKMCRRDRNGDLCLSKEDVEWGKFTPAHAYTVYVSRDLVNRTSKVYNVVVLDTWRFKVNNRINESMRTLNGMFDTVFLPSYKLDNIVVSTALPTTDLIYNHKLLVEMVVPEPQYYSPYHNYMHKNKFAMDSIMEIPVRNNLYDENTTIYLNSDKPFSGSLVFLNKNGNTFSPEDKEYYSINIRHRVEKALKPILTEFIRHQVKSMYFIYDSYQLKFGIINNAENSFTGVTPDLYDSLVGRLLCCNNEVRDHRIEENFEELHRVLGPFLLHGYISDSQIRAKFQFNKEYKIDTNIYGIEYRTSVQDLISQSTDFIISGDNPISYL